MYRRPHLLSKRIPSPPALSNQFILISASPHSIPFPIMISCESHSFTRIKKGKFLYIDPLSYAGCTHPQVYRNSHIQKNHCYVRWHKNEKNMRKEHWRDRDSEKQQWERWRSQCWRGLGISSVGKVCVTTHTILSGDRVRAGSGLCPLYPCRLSPGQAFINICGKNVE